MLANAACGTPDAPIDRQALVARHEPVLARIDPESPFTLGNGRFAFTADITGLQSLPGLYFRAGIPLETKARWAWHSRPNPEGYRLENAFEGYAAYGRSVAFPTDAESAAGQWLRRNPHDLPLARLGFRFDGRAVPPDRIADVQQSLDLWRGELHSHYTLDGTPADVTTVVHGSRDVVAADIRSPLLSAGRLSLSLQFPRGYDPSAKNTPDLVWGPDDEHVSAIVAGGPGQIVFRRRVDDAVYFASLTWSGEANLLRHDNHSFELVPAGGTTELAVTLSFSTTVPTAAPSFAESRSSAETAWRGFWLSGAAIDFSGSSDPRAAELERRLVLSRYLMAAQSRAPIPTQETGLTSSSWYGKHHTEMAWWNSAHWALWGQPAYTVRVLDWYVAHLPSARELAAERGLDGARWAKMVGPENRESPGGNPLIIWNQPQSIHLAELAYRADDNDAMLKRYAGLVEETAAAMASMLVWDAKAERYSLEPPIWIAQEIYAPRRTSNPAFELAYWRYGLQTAQRWRERRGLPPNPDWQQRLDKLAPLPQKDGRYVAIESIPDTFDNVAHRQDHPTMLAPFGLLDDPTVDRHIMNATLDAVLETWDWKTKIWGWDYPMIAMTAARLGRPEDAVAILLADRPHNRYLPNGHCPQEAAQLPVYLPANGALLSAVAMMASGWEGAPDRPAPGFPNDGGWKLHVEGFGPGAGAE